MSFAPPPVPLSVLLLVELSPHPIPDMERIAATNTAAPVKPHELRLAMLFPSPAFSLKTL
jgi:hypothetical protein